LVDSLSFLSPSSQKATAVRALPPPPPPPPVDFFFFFVYLFYVDLRACREVRRWIRLTFLLLFLLLLFPIPLVLTSRPEDRRKWTQPPPFFPLARGLAIHPATKKIEKNARISPPSSSHQLLGRHTVGLPCFLMYRQ